MIVKTVIDVTSRTTNLDGSTFDLEMPKGNRGIAQVNRTDDGTGNLTVTIQGRLSPSMAFVDISNGAITQNTTGSTAVEDIQLYPEMRAKLTVSGGASVDAVVQLGC
tara:strand:+ start:6842 stop:7162 length:321 start_codon:yes stop_codon:yes gene_type:complete